MGATNQIKGTNISLQLEGKICPQCQQPFTLTEIGEGNYDIWFDTTNDVKLIEMKKIEDKMDRLKLAKFNDEYWDLLYYPFGRAGYQLSIWIRSIEHEICPTVEECEKCGSKSPKEEMFHETQGSTFWHKKCFKEYLETEQFPGQHGKNEQERKKRLETLRKKYPKAYEPK
jgi:hypothetical protein